MKSVFNVDSHLKSGQPDGGRTQNCFQIDLSAPTGLRDYPCSHQSARFMCQKREGSCKDTRTAVGNKIIVECNMTFTVRNLDIKDLIQYISNTTNKITEKQGNDIIGQLSKMAETKKETYPMVMIGLLSLVITLLVIVIIVLILIYLGNSKKAEKVKLHVIA